MGKLLGSGLLWQSRRMTSCWSRSGGCYKEQTGHIQRAFLHTARPTPFPPHSQEGNVSVQEWKCCSRWMEKAVLFVDQ
ncbi:unnamed protein product [Tetraodon nigroviridis]|uniref:(spotted green pufferfish) hypothetical protein n=1 Tax=Tetraodon nigroviridis TaxID=99883 RepID=Q4SAA9_TETNG|nr:unnamed protein product [Tetraodon nigroviridis]